MKKRYQLLFTILLLGIYSYRMFVTTDIFVPERKPIATKNELYKAIFDEIAANEKSDSILFSGYFMFYGCGNNDGSPRSPLRRKMDKIRFNEENPYYIDEQMPIDSIYKTNNKTFIVGFTAPVFDAVDKSKAFHRFKSKTINLVYEPRASRLPIYSASISVIDSNFVKAKININMESEVEHDFELKNGRWKKR